MATQTTIKVICDICKKEMSKIHAHNQHTLTVIFTTEQTEGQPVKPYLSAQKIDTCNHCEEIILSGKMVFAYGAQGHNTFFFKD